MAKKGKKKDLGDDEESASTVTKTDKEKALNDFFGTKVAWSVMSTEDLDELMTAMAANADELTKKFYSGSKNKIPVWRELSVMRLETGMQDRLERIKTLVQVANTFGGDGLMGRILEMSQMGKP